jgi:hypothetical protein
MALSISSALVQVAELIQQIGDDESISEHIDAERPQDNKLKSRIRTAADNLSELLEEAIASKEDFDSDEADKEDEDDSDDE